MACVAEDGFSPPPRAQTPALTGEQAVELLDALIAAYSKENVQRKLHARWVAAEGDELKWARMRQEVTLPTQGPIISQYGFQASRAGWAQCMHAFSLMLDAGDPEINERHNVLRYLVEPELQHASGPEGKPLILVDRASPDRCVLESTGRLLEGKRVRLALSSPRGLTIATSEKRFQFGRWAVCELLCGSETQALEASFDGTFITHVADGKVFDVDNGELFAGSHLHLVSGDEKPGALTREEFPGRDFEINLDGTISPKRAPHLAIGVEVHFHPPVPLPATSVEDNICGEGQIWTVIGGGALGGLIVKMGRSLSSQELPCRLATGTRVEQLRRVGDRLHYKRIRGDGPDYGWVSLTYKGSPLLVKVNGDGLVKSCNIQAARAAPKEHDWWWNATIWQGKPLLEKPPEDGSRGLPSDDALEICVLTDQDSYLAGQASGLSRAAFGLDLVKGLSGRRASDQFQACALVRDDALLGFVLFGQLSDKPEMHVHHLAVEEAERRRGHGRRLLEHVRLLCVERGLEWILAECRHHNILYYYNLGFEILGTRMAWKKGLPEPADQASLFKLRLNSSWALRPPPQPGGGTSSLERAVPREN